MLPNIPRITVYIITYNQKEVIDRTLSSVLSQIDYVYEICVSDDCSSDGTWEILLDYSRRFPGLFKLNRNDPNLGIFENTEKVWSMVTGDIAHDLAGDDCVGEGWFKKVVEFILENNIDYRNELFCIYGDYMSIDPTGFRYVVKNDLVASPKNIFSLALRGLIGNRSSCYSVNILKRFFKVSRGRSHIAESAQDRQLQLFTEVNYYIPYIGNIYYTGIGVSTKIVSDDIFNERKQINPYLIQMFADKGYTPSKADLRYIAYDDAFMDFLGCKSLKNALRLIWKWLLSFDPQIGVRSLNIHFFTSHLCRRKH